jgi:hypothetical protein
MDNRMITKTFQQAALDIVGTLGSQSEFERLEAGVLREDELVSILGRELWRPFYGFHVRRRLHPDDVKELAIMHRMAEPEDTVSFHVEEPAPTIKADEWETLRNIKHIAERLAAEVTTFSVVGTCGRKKVRKSYARVAVYVGDRPFKLELCLD